MGYNITLPAVDSAFYTPSEAKQNADKIKNTIQAKYGKIIDNISKITNVPSELITSIIFIESGGNPTAKSAYAAGICQLSNAEASDVIITEKGAGRLEAPEAALLKKYLGNRYSLVESVKKGQKSIGKTFVTDDDLFNPEFSILVSALLLGQLADEFTEDGKINLSKVVTLYNGGRYSKACKAAIKFNGTANELLAQLPKETADYIKKLIGVNSILHSLV